jgi:hypothetical protein
MTLVWKRALLMVAGALLVIAGLRSLVITSIAPSTLPLPPANNEERVIMILTSIALVGLGVYLFVRGKRIRLPK